MRQMKNTRTGKIAVYDADLIETGRWEEVTAESAAKKPNADDEVSVKDEIAVTLIKGTKRESKQPKA
jgi:hypothetical protein